MTDSGDTFVGSLISLSSWKWMRQGETMRDYLDRHANRLNYRDRANAGKHGIHLMVYTECGQYLPIHLEDTAS